MSEQDCNCTTCTMEDKLNALYIRLNIMEDELNHIKEVFKCELETSDEPWEPVVEYAYSDESPFKDD